MKTLSDKPLNLEPSKNGAQIETINFYSEAMQNLFKKITEVAHSQENIIIVGEQGTGKRHTAAFIHSLSACADGPFSELFCHTLEEIIQEKMREPERETKGESDQSSENFGLDFLSGGTLFFNSFSELSRINQEILIRTLSNAQELARETEERNNFKLIISFEQRQYIKLEQEAFWRDLLGQLNPIIIHIPPLRERCEDITLLIDQFLLEYAMKNSSPVHAISPRAVYKCISYHWPGNIRQLKNTIEHAATAVPAGSVITADQLPFSIDWKSPYQYMDTDIEYNKSFLRAEQMLMKELVSNSNISEQELEKIEYEYSIPFRNRTIFLS